MELQLGLSLALPVHNPVKGFDMSNREDGVEKKEILVGLESIKKQVRNKRSFDVAFDESAGNESKMLPLLLWSGQPNEEDDEKGQKRRDSVSVITKNEGEGNHVVGWPPIKSWRKKMLHQHHSVGHDHHHHHQYPHHQNQLLVANSMSMLVKVKMEGVGIVRKIDIRPHHSYQTLKDTLITMFSKCKRSGGKEGGAGAEYILAYQDKQGAWLLVADVPWQTFIKSVQRLQILRNGC